MTQFATKGGTPLPIHLWSLRAVEPTASGGGLLFGDVCADADDADDAGILEAFRALAGTSGSKALGFARKYGPLLLARHGWPVGAVLQQVYPGRGGIFAGRATIGAEKQKLDGLNLVLDQDTSAACEVLTREPQLCLSRWDRVEACWAYARFAEVVEAVLRTAESIRCNKPLTEALTRPLVELWREIHLQAWLQYWIGPTIRWPPGGSVQLAEAPALITQTLNWWFRVGWIAPAFGWGATVPFTSAQLLELPETRGKRRIVRPQIKRHAEGFLALPHPEPILALRTGAWGAIGIRLAEAVAGLPMVRREQCAHCNEYFERKARKRGRPACSPACRQKAAALRKREQRARAAASAGEPTALDLVRT